MLESIFTWENTVCVVLVCAGLLFILKGKKKESD